MLSSSIIGTVVIGFFAGLVARMLHPGDDKLGVLVTIALGVAGAFTAKFVGGFLGLYQNNANVGFVGAVVGALIVLFAYSFYKKKTT